MLSALMTLTWDLAGCTIGLTRLIRPSCVVVIGSYRGFSPLVFGKAQADNAENGTVCFIDPSLVDDFWKEEVEVQKHFKANGVTNIQHHLATTQEFVETDTYRSLKVGVVFIDGYHTAEQARIDFEAFEPLVSDNGVLLLHDSTTTSMSRIYGPGREYERDVPIFVDQLKQDANLQVFDLPFDQGLTLVRKATG
jgi:predicted O-methyltransferase YrrM